MIEGTDGRYYLQGGAILIPGQLVLLRIDARLIHAHFWGDQACGG